ncbi:MAG TPA: type II and III secretion system protein [Candidatus Sumerlaeota bacterium]|nr:type II and III secretion system protein [Candidatus Sumerlaeota bacterium]
MHRWVRKDGWPWLVALSLLLTPVHAQEAAVEVPAGQEPAVEIAPASPPEVQVEAPAEAIADAPEETIAESPVETTIAEAPAAAPAVLSAEEAALVRRNDNNRHMVAIEALVIEINEERTRDLGIRYGFTQVTRNDAGVPVPGGPGVLEGGDVRLGRPLNPVRVPVLLRQIDGVTDIGFEQQRMPGLGITLAGMNVGTGAVSAQLRTLLQSGDASIRTRPIVVALNNTRATIEVADEVPYLDINEHSQVAVAFEPVGVRMAVIPLIKELRPGIVQLEIENLEVSSVSSFITQQNVQRPVFNKSQTSTNVTLSEGETFVIGGLKTQHLTHIEERVPILGAIPGLGWLFKSQEDRERIMDVLFFITPYILEPGENFLLPYDFKNHQALGLNFNVARR